jgi:predicted XRE-type DNA-binding protein
MSNLQFDNIFDVITDNAEESADLQFRADLMLVIREIIESKQWNQTEASEALGVAQPRISEIMRGKIALFSSDKLIGLLAKLGYQIRPQFKLGRQKKLEVKVHQHADRSA